MSSANATSAAVSQQVLAVQPSVQSITSRLLRASPATATTAPPTGVAATLAGVSALHRLNVESLSVLKEKLMQATSSNPASSATSTNPSTAPSITSAEHLPSLTWLTFLKTLPPSGNASNPDVSSLKALFGQFIATVAEVCDDDRDGEALAISAAVVYKALRTRVRKEKEAKAAAAAAAATTSTGADAAAPASSNVNVPASPELLASLKGIAAAAKGEIVKACGRAPESMIVRLLNTLGEMDRIQADMQSKYEQLRLLRELKQLSSSSSNENDGIKIISAPKDASLPSLPLLDREFGSELPIMYDEDSPEMAASDLASKPVMALIEQIKQSLRISQSPSPAASSPPTSLLSLTPSSAASSEYDFVSDFDLSEEEELYVGESDEDEIEREHQRLVDLNNQQVRALSLEKKDRASAAKASSTEPLELPSNPLGWWNWLMGQCDRLVTYNEAGLPVLTANEIATQVLHILQSSRPDVQNDLLETLGFEGIELCETLIKYRKEIKAVTVQHQAQARQTKEQRAAAEDQQTKRGKDGSVVRGLIGISIHSQAELDAAKARKRADRRHMRRSAAAQAEADKYTIDEEKLDAQASLLKPLINVGASQISQQLPAGTTRQHFKGYEEVHIPAIKKPEVDESQLLQIEKNFEPFAQQAFPRMKTLNRIQSKVYQSAYHSNSNMLVCAPTGAGKTNIAMMCVLREIQQHIVNGVLQKDMFKIVYVAPMKALAQEVQEAFQRRLAPLGVLVKELTGDMQLTKKELKETQMLIVTPEKYDVVSRKSGEANLMSLVKLLIIDEVHLLNEDRGPVLEILVARTLRMVETSQQMCRIVGLSATLPNHQDVAVFLKCGPGGIFHFDASYRPVPLAQTFIGVTEKNSMLRLQSMNEITFKKVLEAVKLGRQVMVFVHSRRDTVKTARFLRDMAQKENASAFFDSSKDEQYATFEKKVMRSRNSDLTELFQYGFSMHNAGMVRSDRSLVESAFGAGLIKVLCCTATLAWGVNLPAHTCIIKGTQIYNAEKGGFTDIGILDIQQIFGRAGRPQFIGDDFGEAMLICEHDKLQHYLSLLTHQLPIESQFIKELPNHLNAEIILGTVTNLHEAVEWLSYTYLYTRMLRNPMVYGISFDEMQFDELLINHRTTLIIEAAKTLMRCRMIKFDQKSGQFYSTDVGRVAAHYYLHFESIELYNDMLKPIMTDEEILHLLASSKEFTQIKVRDEEINEIDKLKKKFVPINIKGGFESNTGKQNLLLQCYISNAVIDTPTLISDSYFIQQSAGRICRALFEMVLKRGKAFLASKFLTYAKCIELKIWEFQSPLRQFLSSRDLSNQGGNSVGAGHSSQGGLLKMPTIMKLEEKNLKVDQLIDMEANEISGILKHNSLGHTVKQALSYIPFLSVEATIQPITRSVLKIDMELRAEFVWHDRQHGNVESFWIWIEDTNNEHIYHSEHFLLHKKEMNEVHKLTFTIPIFEPLPPQYYIRVVSDRWLGSDNVVALNFKHLILPELYPANTALLDLHPLPRSALMNAAYEKMYEKKFQYFNPIQTQIFHTLYHTDENVLLGAPTGSGKTIVAELAILRLLSMYPGQKVVYIAPLKALARERIEDWNSAKSFKGMLNKKIVELTGDTAPDQAAILAADIIITTPEKFDGTSRGWKSRAWVQKIALVIVDEIHLLGADRGPVLEVIVSRMRFISSHTSSPIRIVGLSTALSNAKDLADWLGIEKAGLFNFPPSVRPVPLTIHIAGYAGQHFCPRMATMNKPTYAAIQTHSPAKPSLVFVASRRQTRLTALDLIAFSAADGDPRKWLHMSEAELQKVLKQVSDPTLRHMISFGIGMHHAGLQSRDRQIVEKLFLDFKIQVLVCTSTLAWGVNFPCHLVVVKGTEFYDAKVKRYVDMPITDVLQMIGRAGRPQFDVDAKAVVLVHEPKKNYYLNFLHSPFPVESSLLSHLHDHINAEICGSGTIKSVPDLLDYLSWTFFFRRLLLNPSYYGLEDVSSESLNRYLMELVVRVLGDLERSGLIMQEDETRKIVPLTLGKIASFYYLKYTTMMVFSEMLRPDANVENLLQVLAYVKEYEELPVRHNEDKFNAELNSSMKWPVDTASFDSPHVKAHMLFQAHFSRLELPISDYYLDLKSMLDQSIRILQAMVDTTAEAGWLATSLNVMNLMQMVVQGRWKDDSTLLNLPGFEQHEKLAHTLRGEKLDSLLRVAQTDKGKLASICKKSGMNEKETEEFVEAASRMPVIQMNLSQVSDASAASSSSASTVKSEPAKRKNAPTTPIQPHTPLSVPARSTLNLQVSLHRTNSNPNVRILTPVFSKPKDEGWWLVVGMAPGNKKRHGHGNDASAQHLLAEAQDELVTMKRVNNLKNRQTINVKVQVPDFVGPHSYTVYLVSDSYLGLDQVKHFEIHTTANGNARNAADDDDIYS